MGRVTDNLFYLPLLARRVFPESALEQVSAAIAEAEAEQGCEIVFIVEGSLDLKHLARRMTPRDRAVDLFAKNRIWDTESNTGILVYLLLAERAVEIVADRGVTEVIDDEQFDQVIHEIVAEIRKQNELHGVLSGVRSLARLLKPHYPPKGFSELNNDALRLR